MKIDLTPVLNGEVKELPFTFTENVPAEIAEIRFKGLDMTVGGKLTVNGKVRDISGYFELDVAASLPCVTHCARCGRQMSVSCGCDLHLIASKDAEHSEDEGYIVYSDRQIDIDGPVYEELSISFPSKPLCREDCRGLCPVCGADLNEGGCEHIKNEEKDTL